MNRSDFQRKHKGEPGYIIGSGPSLPVHDVKLRKFLDSRITIGTNRAYEWFPPTYLVISDFPFWRRYKASFEPLSSIIFVQEPVIPPQDYTERTIGLPWSSRPDLLTPEFFTGPFPFYNNTGVAALRIAHVLGCNPLYLLGIDLLWIPKRHWHEDYSNPRTQEQHYKAFAEVFRTTICAMQIKGKRIYSCSPVSVLNDLCPFYDYKELYEHNTTTYHAPS